MKSYPYIGKVEAEGGSSILIKSSKNVGYIIKNNLDDALEGVWEGGYNGDAHIKNITEEYLANTYGEVKSKEHAEFIKLLAETNDIPCAVLSIDMNYTMFYVLDGCLFFCLKEIDVVGDYKKITIPLPPECESVDEWPKVGDDVLIPDNVQLFELNRFKGKTCKVIGICESDGKKVLTLEHKSHGLAALNMGGWIQKPKTPEQELEYDLTDLIMRARDADVDDVTIARSILSKYSITKKPQ